MDRLDGTRVARISLRRKVPWIPNFEEVLHGWDREEDDVLQPNHLGVGYDGLGAREIRDAIHKENVLEAIRGEGESVTGHRLFSGS